MTVLHPKTFKQIKFLWKFGWKMKFTTFPLDKEKCEWNLRKSFRFVFHAFTYGREFQCWSVRSNGMFVRECVKNKRKNLKGCEWNWKRKIIVKREREREFLTFHLKKHFQCIYTTNTNFEQIFVFYYFFLFTIYMIIESHYDKYQLDYFYYYLILANLIKCLSKKNKVDEESNGEKKLPLMTRL